MIQTTDNQPKLPIRLENNELMVEAAHIGSDADTLLGDGKQRYALFLTMEEMNKLEKIINGPG